jgi:hypothetical protein
MASAPSTAITAPRRSRDDGVTRPDDVFRILA